MVTCAKGQFRCLQDAERGGNREIRIEWRADWSTQDQFSVGFKRGGSGGQFGSGDGRAAHTGCWWSSISSIAIPVW